MKTRWFRLHSLFILFLLVWACKSKQNSPSQKTSNAQKKTTSSSKTTSTKPKSKDPLQQALGLSSKDIKQSELYSFIQDWYGVPYKYGGCKKSGVDCSCFANILYEEVYRKKLSGNAADMYKSSEKITLEKAKEGDLVFFKINVSYVSHVGVLLKNGAFVHASSSQGVTVSRLSEAYYKKYFHSAGRF